MPSYAQKRLDTADIVRDVREADFHDKSLSSGARISVRALGSACLRLSVFIGSQLSLSAGFLRNAEPDIHSLYRVLGTVTED
jgi:hypothetical protein